nr:BICD family-like cargo adapter 1 [Solea senegalensis]
MSLIRRLCVEEGAATQLTDKLTENLREILSDNKAALQTLRTEITEKENSMKKEIEALTKAGRDRERDLDILTTVLQCNQDVIKDLQVALAEKEHLQEEVEKERELWRQRDQALAAVQQEKDALIRLLKEELQNPQNNVPVSRAALLEEREVNSATLCQEVTKLTTALQEYQDMVQSQQQKYSETVSSLRTQLRDTRQELREKEKEKKEAERSWQNTREDGEREDRKLRDSLDKRDKLIERILLDAEERDRVFRELQLNLHNKANPLTAVKHTL